MRCERVSLCSAGIDAEERVVIAVSHSPLVGQHLQLVSNFHDASMLLAALLTPPEQHNHKALVDGKYLLNANYPNINHPCVTPICKTTAAQNEK